MTYYTRRPRRRPLCMRAPGKAGALAGARNRIALAAGGDELVQVAARIAEELELSPEMVDLLLFTPAPAPAGLTRRRGRP